MLAVSNPEKVFANCHLSSFIYFKKNQLTIHADADNNNSSVDEKIFP